MAKDKPPRYKLSCCCCPCGANKSVKGSPQPPPSQDMSKRTTVVDLISNADTHHKRTSKKQVESSETVDCSLKTKNSEVTKSSSISMMGQKRREKLQDLFWKSVVENDLDMVVRCIHHGAHINIAYCPHNQTVLHEASRRGQLDMVEHLLRAGADPNIQDLHAFLPIHYAVQGGHFHTAKCLLMHGSRVTKHNEYGDAVIHTCVRYGHAPLLPLILSSDVSMEISKTVEANATLNHSAALKDRPERWQFFHLNMQNLNGDTPLHIASALGRKNIVKCLLQWGADTNVINKQGTTPLAIATEKQFMTIIKLLRQSETIGSKQGHVHALDPYGAFPFPQLNKMHRFEESPNVVTRHKSSTTATTQTSVSNSASTFDNSLSPSINKRYNMTCSANNIRTTFAAAAKPEEYVNRTETERSPHKQKVLGKSTSCDVGVQYEQQDNSIGASNLRRSERGGKESGEVQNQGKVERREEEISLVDEIDAALRNSNVLERHNISSSYGIGQPNQNRFQRQKSKSIPCDGKPPYVNDGIDSLSLEVTKRVKELNSPRYFNKLIYNETPISIATRCGVEDGKTNTTEKLSKNIELHKLKKIKNFREVSDDDLDAPEDNNSNRVRRKQNLNSENIMSQADSQEAISSTATTSTSGEYAVDRSLSETVRKDHNVSLLDDDCDENNNDDGEYVENDKREKNKREKIVRSQKQTEKTNCAEDHDLIHIEEEIKESRISTRRKSSVVTTVAGVSNDSRKSNDVKVRKNYHRDDHYYGESPIDELDSIHAYKTDQRNNISAENINHQTNDDSTVIIRRRSFYQDDDRYPKNAPDTTSSPNTSKLSSSQKRRGMRRENNSDSKLRQLPIRAEDMRMNTKRTASIATAGRVSPHILALQNQLQQTQNQQYHHDLLQL